MRDPFLQGEGEEQHPRTPTDAQTPVQWGLGIRPCANVCTEATTGQAHPCFPSLAVSPTSRFPSHSPGLSCQVLFRGGAAAAPRALSHIKDGVQAHLALASVPSCSLRYNLRRGDTDPILHVEKFFWCFQGNQKGLSSKKEGCSFKHLPIPTTG